MISIKHLNKERASGYKKLKTSIAFRLPLLVLFLSLVFLSNTSWAIEKCEVKIFSRNAKVDQKQIKLFLNTVDVVIARNLPVPQKHKKRKLGVYTVVLIKEKDFKKVEILPEKKNGIRFYLPENTAMWTDNDKIIAQLISAILLKKCGYPQDKNLNKLPPWLIYGILSKIRRRFDKANIPGIMTFPGVHMLLTTNPPPDLLKIAASPVTPEDGPAYQVFMEASEILLSSIRRLPKSREGIKDLIDLSMRGASSKKSFLQIFAKKVHTLRENTTEIVDEDKSLQNYDELQKWLNESAILMSVNAFKPGNAHFAEKQFRKIEIVKYISLIERGEKANEERYCKVEALPDNKLEIKNFPSVVKQKEIEFARLEFAVPASIQPSAYRIKQALNKLRTDSSYNFKKEYLSAKQDFYNEIDKYSELEVYMREMELRFVPESWRYRTELQEIKIWDKKRQKRWPALTKYLDSIDKER